MAWSESASLTQRFQGILPLAPRGTGRTYQGWVKASRRWSPMLLSLIAGVWCELVRTIARGHWLTGGWVVMGVDGSKLDLPRTAANERAFGVSGKTHGGPQACLCVVLHLATGLPWCWKIGRAMTSERHMLRQMIHHLPAQCLLVADAGFTGYALWRALADSNRSFLIRAGANVRLLKRLGYVVRERGDLVYLWPKEAQTKRQPPMILRLIEVRDGDNRMCLLTNVLNSSRLSDAQAACYYRWRWGIELWFRGMKQTLQRRKLRSDAPVQAALELRWAVLAMALLGLLGVREQLERGGDPQQLSFAGVLCAVRTIARRPDQCGSRHRFKRMLAKAVKDTYIRRGSKKARGWPHKKNDPPAGVPKITDASESQRRLAQRLRCTTPAA